MRVQMQALEYNYNSLFKINLEKYAGMWIAVLNGEIIAYAEDLRQVYKKAKEKHPKEEILFSKIPEDAPLIL